MIFIYYIGLFIFLLLNQSLYVFGGDSAEFSLVASTISVAHPPGYPLYSLFAVLINRIIPFFTTPWRVALLSSVSTVATSYLLYLTLKRFKVSAFSALLGSTLYVFLFPVWLYSEVPEVFALSNAISLFATFSIFCYTGSKNRLYLYLFSFLFGLGLSHHHIFILFIPAWVYLLMLYKKELLKIGMKEKMIMGGLVILGASFYLYAVVASIYNPPLDWENAKTITGLYRLFTRATYGTFKAYAGSTGNILNQFFDVFSFLIFILHDFRVIGISLIVMGFVALRKNKELFMFTSILLVSHVFFLFYTNFVLFGSFTLAMYERFLIPIYMILIIPLAFGIDSIVRAWKVFVKKAIHNSQLLNLVKISIYVFLASYVFVIVMQNYRLIRRIPSMSYFSQYAKDLLDTVPKNAIFFVGADNSHFTASYYRYSQLYRNDVKFVFVNILDKSHYRVLLKKRYPDLYVPDNYKKGEDLLKFLKKNYKYGIYFENPLAASSWKPYGLLWKYFPSEIVAASESANLIKQNSYLWEKKYHIPKLDREDKKILHLNVVQDHYLEAYTNYSKLLFATKHIEEAEKVLKTIYQDYRRSDPKSALIYVNLLVYQKKCNSAIKIMDTLSIDTLLEYPELIPSLKDYFDACNKKSEDSKKVSEAMKKNIKHQKSLLEDF